MNPFGPEILPPSAPESQSIIHVPLRALSLQLSSPTFRPHAHTAVRNATRYKPLLLSHSSVTGTDLLRLLCLEPALQLLLQAAHGRPRLVNHLAQRAMEQAANQSVRTISAAHVQSALDLMPWLAKL